MTSARSRHRRHAAGLTLSLVVHTVLLLAFMSVTPRLLTSPRLPGPPEPTVKLELRRAAAGAAPSAISASRRSRVEPSASISTSQPTPDILQPEPQAKASPPARLQPPGAIDAASSASSEQGAGDGRWRVRGEGGDAGAAARALARGTVGCGAADYLHLTSDERDHCYAELLRGMRTLKPDAISPAKRAYFDQVVAAYAKMHAPMPLSQARLGDNLGVQERWEAPPGAHPPGIGCAIAFGKPRGWKAYANRAQPPHTLKLGPLPCFVSPPSGLNTEEADVPPPASLREQEDDAAHAARYAPVGSHAPGG